MTYVYKCKTCKTQIEINKAISKVSRKEFCIKCNCELERVYIASAIKTSDGFKG
jgi:predicted nucleic acid-binding Zn ribbon protein